MGLCRVCYATCNARGADYEIFKAEPDTAHTKSSFQYAVAQGCPICLYLLRSQKSSGSSLTWPVYLRENEDERKGYHLAFDIHRNKCEFRWVLFRQGRSFTIPAMMKLELVTADPHVEFSERLRSTGSETVLQLGLSWVRECDKNHLDCKHPVNSRWYPTRLIDVLGPDDTSVKLITTAKSSICGPYLTLSHRWGSSRPLMLLTTNVSIFHTTIPIKSLSAVFRDAIHVCRQWNVQYLWIDCLCIIQDQVDSSDWLRESRQMHRIYGEALCNLAATTTKSYGGLFQERCRSPNEKFSFSPTNAESCLRSGDWVVTNPDYWSEVDKAPLHRRAWVIQERFLAKRVIHFMDTEIFFECKKFIISERFPGRLACQLSPQNPFKSWGLAASRDIGPEYTWDALLRAYLSASLTKATDRSVAILGIARRFEALYEDEFVLGLWRSKPEHYMLWWTSNVTISPFDKQDDPGVPSFSPLSQNCKVDFVLSAGVARIPDQMTSSAVETGCMGDFSFQVINILCIPSTGTNIADSAQVIVRGKLFAVELCLQERHAQRKCMAIFRKGKTVQEPILRLDKTSVPFVVDGKHGMKCHALAGAIARTKAPKSYERHIHLILVTQDRDRSIFKRIGLLSSDDDFHQNADPDECNVKEFVIV